MNCLHLSASESALPSCRSYVRTAAAAAAAANSVGSCRSCDGTGDGTGGPAHTRCLDAASSQPSVIDHADVTSRTASHCCCCWCCRRVARQPITHHLCSSVHATKTSRASRLLRICYYYYQLLSSSLRSFPKTPYQQARLSGGRVSQGTVIGVPRSCAKLME